MIKAVDGGPQRRVHLPAEGADPESGLRHATIGDLAPGTHYEVDIHGNGHTALPDLVFFPNEVRTLEEPPGDHLCTIATVSDLEKIAISDDADIDAMKGWRRQIFGEDALKLKRGELALVLDGARVRVVELEPEDG